MLSGLWMRKDLREDELEEDTEVCHMIASFRFIRCNYKKYDNAEYFLYESLSASLILIKRSWVVM